jgi:hypothetical protein
VHAQEQQSVLLRPEEIDGVHRARHTVERNKLLVVGRVVERLEWLGSLAVRAFRDGLKAQLVAEPVGALRFGRERLREPMHADVEDGLVGAADLHAAEVRDRMPLVRAGTHGEVLAEEWMLRGTGDKF